MTPFKDTKDGQTHYVGDGCNPPHEPIGIPKDTTGKKHCVYYNPDCKICEQPTGKRWWESSFEQEFQSKSYLGKKSGDFQAVHWTNEHITLDSIKDFIAKVEEQAFRKGVEAPLGALPDVSGYHDRAQFYERLAKENIGRLIK